jgi:hypothetical protein
MPKISEGTFVLGELGALSIWLVLGLSDISISYILGDFGIRPHITNEVPANCAKRQQ